MTLLVPFNRKNQCFLAYSSCNISKMGPFLILLWFTPRMISFHVTNFDCLFEKANLNANKIPNISKYSTKAIV